MHKCPYPGRCDEKTRRKHLETHDTMSVKREYSYIGTGYGDPFAGLDLTYTYHNHKVNVDSTLNIKDPDQLK